MLKADIPFARDDANRFLPWMVALMCAISALMLCTGITFGQWVRGQQGQFSNSLTVQVPPQGDRQAQVMKQVTAVLEKARGAGTVTTLDERKVRELIEPWVGSGESLRSLPLPTVMEVPAGDVDMKSLEKQLKAISPDISVDSQEQWAEKFATLSRILQGGLYSLAACVVIALGGMMVFTARAALKLHAGSVLLLHSIGADDGYIARQFQANAVQLAIRGAVPGTLFAGAAYGVFGLYAAHLGAPLVPGMLISARHAAVLLGLPVACCAISILVVRAATIKQLKLLP